MKPSSAAGSLCQANTNWKEKIPPAFGNVERCPITIPTLCLPSCIFHLHLHRYPPSQYSIFILILHLHFHPPSSCSTLHPHPILMLQPSSLSSTPNPHLHLYPHAPTSSPITFHHPLLCAAPRHSHTELPSAQSHKRSHCSQAGGLPATNLAPFRPPVSLHASVSPSAMPVTTSHWAVSSTVLWVSSGHATSTQKK